MKSMNKWLFLLGLINLSMFEFANTMWIPDDIKQILAFVENEHASKQLLESAEKEAKKLVSSTQSNIYGIEIFKALFKKGYGFNDAIEAAKTKFLSLDIKPGFNLFIELFKYNQGFDAAIEIAKNETGNVQDDSHPMQSNVILGLNMFVMLIEKHQGFDEAIDAVEKITSTKNCDFNVHLNAYNLYTNIIKKLKELLLSTNTDPQIESWCNKAMIGEKNTSNPNINSWINDLSKSFKTDFPTLHLQHKLIILKASLENLKLTLTNLNEKLKKLQLNLN